MMTTNPQRVNAPKQNSGPSRVDKLLKFNEIEYPDLDKGFMASANSTAESAKSHTGPLYPSTKDLPKNAAVLSGAITISRNPDSGPGKDPFPGSHLNFKSIVRKHSFKIL